MFFSAPFGTQTWLALDNTILQHLPPGFFGQWPVIKKTSFAWAEPDPWCVPGDRQSMALSPVSFVLLAWLVLAVWDG